MKHKENLQTVSVLLIREPHLGRILDGSKTWEIRGVRTHYRGRLILARSGSGLLVGECRLTDVLGPLSMRALTTTACLPKEQKEDIAENGVVPYSTPEGMSRTFAWVMSDPIIYPEPVPYRHPQGAVIFMNISAERSPEWFSRYKHLSNNNPFSQE